jgi:hypothetical protein
MYLFPILFDLWTISNDKNKSFEPLYSFQHAPRGLAKIIVIFVTNNLHED